MLLRWYTLFISLIRLIRGASPLGLPCTLSRAPLRRRAPFLSEGLRPSDSPTRSLTRRCAGALRSRGSLADARSRDSNRQFMR